MRILKWKFDNKYFPIKLEFHFPREMNADVCHCLLIGFSPTPQYSISGYSITE